MATYLTFRLSTSSLQTVLKCLDGNGAPGGRQGAVFDSRERNTLRSVVEYFAREMNRAGYGPVPRLAPLQRGMEVRLRRTMNKYVPKFKDGAWIAVLGFGSRRVNVGDDTWRGPVEWENIVDRREPSAPEPTTAHE